MGSAPHLLSVTLRRPLPSWSSRETWLGVSRGARIALAVVAAFMLTIATGLLLYATTHTDRIYEGVRVAGISVGGLTKAEARTAIEAAFAQYADQTTLTLEHGDQQFAFSARDAGVTLDAEASVDAAFAYGREGSIWDRSRDWARALLRTRSVPLQVTVDTSRLDARLTAFAEEVIYPPTDAAVVFSGAGPEIVPEQPGLAFDLGATRALVLDRFRTLSGEPVPLITQEVPARVAASDLTDELTAARSIAANSFAVTGLNQRWIISADYVQRLIRIPPGGGDVSVDREAIESYVAALAETIERPAKNAKVKRKGSTFVVVPSASEVDVDSERSTEAIVSALVSGKREASLVISETAPVVGDEQAEAAAARANELVANGIKLEWDGGNARLGRADLARALVIDERPGEPEPFVLSFSHEKLTELLAPLADEVNVPARDAKFRLVKNKIRVAKREVVGRQLNIEAGSAAIAEALLDGKRSVTLSVETIEPQYTAADAKRIKLPDILAEASTYYGNSSEARRHNVETAVRLEDGWLVPPGGQFSYVEYVGRVSEEEGFVTGFGIVASPEGDGTVTTAPVVGGGICQVSTTIFQAAFWAGLQIDERYEHPYWLQTYGEPPRGMKGLDAMVNVEEDWALDLKFTNTTGNWIAVVVVADGQNVTAAIRGTDPGWTVQVFDPVITDVVPPDTRTYYTESPELPRGQEMQVETAQEGFTATVHRVVTDRDGNVIDDFVMTSTYAPSRNTILRGTGPVEG